MKGQHTPGSAVNGCKEISRALNQPTPPTPTALFGSKAKEKGERVECEHRAFGKSYGTLPGGNPTLDRMMARNGATWQRFSF